MIAALSLGPGYPGYDAAWALVWGGQLAGGALPDYQAPFAPTPHPLANLVAVPLSLAADGGVQGVLVITYVSFAALLVGLVALGGRWAGGVAAVVVASFSVLQREVAFASLDIPYLALLVWAAALEVRRPRRGAAVQVLLVLAGLLRPEAWLLALAYAAWLGRRQALPLAVAAPVIWAATDLLVTGSPTYSFTGTRALAADLGRPTGLHTAIVSAPSSLADLMGTLPLLAGVVGLVAGLALQPRRFAGPAAVLGIGLLTYALLGVAELPVLLRYLLVPACVLALVAGMGAELRLPVALVIGALLLCAIPSTLGGLRDARAFTHARRTVHDDLLQLARTPAFQRAAAGCPAVYVPDFRARPLLALTGVTAPVRVANLPDGRPGLLVTYANERVRRVFTLGARGEVQRQAAPAGARPLARSGTWRAYEVC
ncbi:hypothetical protein C8N24_6146 [Solirubrobacter pauli]|uniref:Dolichyl-phosphate-mannose-protein mannosyltransferase n=1 Tax=Solirubrobacter pauli TaxID=166793 RepID=A0A660L2F1_9ACTN|nr:hypothetical protein C8N24_6146 [Solirubrobacter pauli]